ncbi:MAG: choice-of-anchor D domain-containing protein [Pseudomonadota bacterium]|nr:MAG: choice-of-anchor D domain-containing protein [Pseudomonadota bacterium]
MMENQARRFAAGRSLLAAAVVCGALAAGTDSASAGVSDPQTVTISNDGVGASTLMVSAITMSNGTHFALVSGGSCPAPPFALDGGESCTQWVVFDPQSNGEHTDTVVVSSDAPEVTNDIVTLQGTGVPGPTPELAITPDPLDFGLVAAANLPIDDSFTVSNNGDPGTSLTVSNLQLTGDSEFSILSENCLGSVLFDGDSCTVTIRFNAASDGAFAGQLTVDSDAGSVAAQIQGATQIPAQLAFVVQPSNVSVNSVITPAMVVEVQTSSGDLVTLDNSTIVELEIAGDPSGEATADGTLSRQVSGGQATFDDISIDRVGAGFTLRAVDGAGLLDSDVSTPFDVIAGAPAALAFGVEPGNTQVNATISPPVTVEVLDAWGNRVDWDNTTSVGLALSGGNPAAVLGGGGAQAVSAGVASFSALTVDQAASGYVLEATASGGLVPATSTAFDITPGDSTLEITGFDPAASQTVGEPYTVSISIAGAAPSGEVTISDNGNSCVVDLDLGQTGCELVSTSAGARTITAVYPGDANNAASQDSAGYQIDPASTTLEITAIDPAGSQSVNAPYTVTVGIDGFSPGGTVSVNDGQGAVCTIVLPDPDCDLVSTSVGPRTITASYSGDANNSPDSASASYEIVAGAPDQLVFTIQPGNTSSGQPITPPVVVQVQDAWGNPVVDDNATVVELLLQNGTPGAQLSGGDPATVSAGQAGFGSLTVDLVGSGYRLRAQAAGLSSATSDPFEVGPGTAVELRFDSQPTTTLVGGVMTPAVTVSVRDQAGNLVDSDNTTEVQLSLSGGTPGATLSNGGPQTVINGLANFGALSVDLTGLDYQLGADDASGPLAGDLSDLFNIVSTASTTSILAINPAGSQTVGQPYTVQVDVDGASPAGPVTVSDGVGGSCLIDFPTSDSCALTTGQAGLRTITASFAGDANNASSSDQTGYTIDPVQSIVSIDGLVPASEQVVNQPYTVQVSVTGFSPGGAVLVDDGQGNDCQINLPDASCQLVSGSVGPVTISASYPGDDNNLGASDSAAYEIVRAETTTEILGVNPPDEQQVDEPYTVFVSVSGQSPGGEVTVSDDQGEQCLVDLDLGQISCELVSSVVGTRTLTASYPGDAFNAPSQDQRSYDIIGSGPVALAFAVEPDYGVVNGPLLPRVVVYVVDSQGQLVIDDDSTEVEVRLAAAPAGGSLSGTLLLTVSQGVARFEDLSIDRAGDGYQLEARTPNIGLTPTTGAAFRVRDDQLLRDRFEAVTDELFRDRFEP